MKTIAEIAMQQKKETKGTFVYEAIHEDQPVTQVYVKKALFPNGAPTTIKFSVADPESVGVDTDAILADIVRVFDEHDDGQPTEMHDAIAKARLYLTGATS